VIEHFTRRKNPDKGSSYGQNYSNIYFWPMIARTLLLLFSLSCLPGCGKEQVSVTGFRELPSPTRDDLSAIAFRDSLHGSLTGGKAWERGFIISTDDGGYSWRTDTLLNRKLEHICFDPTGQGYACGQDMILYRPPGEQHWAMFRTTYQWFRACHFLDGKRGCAVGGEGYHGGLTHSFGPEPFWQTDTTHTFPNEIQSVWYADATTLHAAGFGWVMRSDNMGRSWQRLDITGDFFQSVHFPTPDTGFLCGNSGNLYKTTDGGRSWLQIRQGGSTGNRLKKFRSLWFATPETGWVVGEGGIFWQTEDGGNNWRAVAEAPTDADYTYVYTFGNKGWATAKGGRLFCFEW